MKIALTLLLAVLLSSCVAAGDLVWLDENANGIQDSGEPGVEGVTVRLYNTEDSSLVSTALTGADGTYQVGQQGVNSGAYYLEFEIPLGYGFTQQGQGNDPALDSDVDPITGRTEVMLINSRLSDVDAGLVLIVPIVPETDTSEPAAAGITGFTWLDENADGLQDAAEPPLAEVIVRLLDAQGDMLDELTSDAAGLYEFTALPVGKQYRVAFQPPADYQFTQMDAGDDAADSDADTNSGQTETFTLDTAGVRMDAGFVSTAPSSLGPDDFPAGYNPLTGQPLCVPEAAEWSVVGISISQFPPAATRPPTGLEWVAWVSEWWIGEGSTRLYAQFYGCYPEIDLDQVLGDQAGSDSPETAENQFIIGDRVWYDNNGNSLQDEGEPGVPGIGVELILQGQVIGSTTTDGAGKYFFQVEPQYGYRYQVRFSIPSSMQTFYFVAANASADDSIDSDADPATGQTAGFVLPEDASQLLDIDAGVRHAIRIEGVRSGRLVYETMRGYFEGCTVIAGADPEVLAQIQVCAQASSTNDGDIGAAGIDVTRLQEIAAENVGLHGPPNLTGNLFQQAPPEGCTPAASLTMFYNVANQTYWSYDADRGAYLRHQNTNTTPEVQEVSTEALTGQPLHFENVMVFFVEHQQLNEAGTIFDVSMEGTIGRVKLLRDGLVCDLYWSTINGEYEQETGRLRPIRFVYADGTPFPLKPGKLFMHMVHLNADFFEPEPGSGDWRARWYLP
ncbi:MAG: DUF3048 C-terminal domain-containing protein [Anaerolineales bacterium]|nr:DUF3048 C-terminal domain-containing protein [Anaerolineales bacterium]MCW5855253.1 DUF3048 C-terminal domain-containing protein [Anaerolineales bacterium]